MDIKVGLNYLIKGENVVVTYIGSDLLTIIYTSTGKRQNMSIGEFKRYLG